MAVRSCFLFLSEYQLYDCIVSENEYWQRQCGKEPLLYQIDVDFKMWNPWSTLTGEEVEKIQQNPDIPAPILYRWNAPLLHYRGDLEFDGDRIPEKIEKWRHVANFVSTSRGQVFFKI